MGWRATLSYKQLDELELAAYYKAHVRHLTPEGDRLILIAKLGELLDLATGSQQQEPEEGAGDNQLSYRQHDQQ
jgi:hypothetical protein